MRRITVLRKLQDIFSIKSKNYCLTHCENVPFFFRTNNMPLYRRRGMSKGKSPLSLQFICLALKKQSKKNSGNVKKMWLVRTWQPKKPLNCRLILTGLLRINVVSYIFTEVGLHFTFHMVLMALHFMLIFLNGVVQIDRLLQTQKID